MSVRPLLVGGGKMGSALLAGWLDHGIAGAAITIVEPDAEARARAAALGVRVCGDVAELQSDHGANIVVFAIKPQAMAAALPAYRRFASGAVFLSIAAGQTIAGLERHLGAAAVVRAMPNTPAAVHRGIAVACANSRVDGPERDACGGLLAAVGEVVWVDDESLMDAVTATSGSGPAYVFLLIECLAGAGAAAGLPADLAMRLARATVTGAGELAYRDDAEAAALRRNVTSPGGTTEAALEVLMAADGLQPLMTRAVAAAATRARELAS